MVSEDRLNPNIFFNTHQHKKSMQAKHQMDQHLDKVIYADVVWHAVITDTESSGQTNTSYTNFAL